MKSSRFLDTMTRSLTERRRATHHSSRFSERFRGCDSDLLNLISQWESSFASVYPVFDAWVKLQRKTLPIPDLATEIETHLESFELQIFEFTSRRNDLIRESRTAQTELDSILTIFTPSLEEAFANVDDESTWTAPSDDSRLHEVIGANDELFTVARQKYNYLLKKLIPQMSKLKDECDAVKVKISTQTHSDDRWNKCLKNLVDISKSLDDQIKSISSSSTYNNLMVLLASQGGSGQVAKRFRGKEDERDKEYDDWF